jgi:hypothetical protein
MPSIVHIVIIEDTAFIVRSNKRANQYNEKIRTKILDKESELSQAIFDGCQKIIILVERDHAGFIANGDIIEVLEIFNIKELYGFKFANVKIRMVDYPDQNLETVLLLDTIKANRL